MLQHIREVVDQRDNLLSLHQIFFCIQRVAVDVVELRIDVGAGAFVAEFLDANQLESVVLFDNVFGHACVLDQLLRHAQQVVGNFRGVLIGLLWRGHVVLPARSGLQNSLLSKIYLISVVVTFLYQMISGRLSDVM